MKQLSSEKSFSLVEALVGITIILTLSAILLPNYGAFSRQFSLLRSTYRLAQDLRRVQEMAISAKELPSEGVPPGYGIYLEMGSSQTSYRLYADTSPLGGDERYDAGDAIVETINLGKGVYIKEISPLSPLSVNFKGPAPITTISGAASSAIISLALEADPESIQKVIVNKVGLIYVE